MTMMIGDDDADKKNVGIRGGVRRGSRGEGGRWHDEDDQLPVSFLPMCRELSMEEKWPSG